jgi:hypothetical protein
MVALLFLTPLLYGLWWTEPPPNPSQGRMSPSTSPFPAFPLGPLLHVVEVNAAVNESTRLTLLSLEGLVNRERVELYLDFAGEAADSTSILSFLRDHYGVATDSLTVDAALEQYLPRVSGLIVYDPQRPESVNVATMLAGIRSAAIVGPETAASLSARVSKPILLDYATSDWARLDAVGAYDRALAELYPSCDPNLLAILPPEYLALRDYLVATRTFVFFDNQGVLATPGEIASTERILRATPRGIPILGWVRSPTLTEENAFVQLASAEGKFVVGSALIPNLSALTSFGRSGTFRQPAPAPTPALVEDRIYAVVAIADGDSLDFVGNRMRELWNDPTRGSYPVAWSLNPLLAELAPPYLEYYYSSASANDRFVAGPSGAGYLYPDYLGPGDLDPYLQFSARYVQRADMDIAWLLNAFTASEIQYSPASLSAYVDGLHPQGIVLDYDDQPTTASMWMQGGTGSAAPVVRSTQMWTTRANFLAKASAALDATPRRPYFLWMTVYPWRFDLAGTKAVLDELSAREGGRLEIVAPEQFFGLMVQAFQEQAAADLDAMRADPIAATFLGGFLDSAQDHVTASAEAARIGNMQRSAYESYIASSVLRESELLEDLLLVFAIVGIVGAVALYRLARKRSSADEPDTSLGALLIAGGTFALLQVDLWAVLQLNFWTYGYVALGAIATLFSAPLHQFLAHRHPRRHLPVTVLLFLVASGLTLVTGAGFPLASLMAATSLRILFDGRAASQRVLLAGFLLGTVVGLLTPVHLATLGVLGAITGVASLRLRGAPLEVVARPRARGAWQPAFLSMMALLPLTAFLSYSVGLRLEVTGTNLRILGIALLAATGVLALALSTLVPHEVPASFSARALAVAALFSAGMLLVSASVTASLMLLGAATAFALAAWSSLKFHAETGRLSDVVGPLVALVPLGVLLVRMPPVAYSLAVGGLPEPVEAVLYAPPVLWTAIAVVGVALSARRALRRALSRKVYDPLRP